MGKLTTFLYDYLTRQTSNEQSSIWLPKALSPYIPIRQEEPLEIQADSVCEEMTEQMIQTYRDIVDMATENDDPDVNKQFFDETVVMPKQLGNGEVEKIKFTASNIVVKGIENLLMGDLADVVGTDTKYILKYPVSGPAYPLEKHSLEPLEITLDYRLEQVLCAYLTKEAEKREYVLAKDIHVEKYLPNGWPECDLVLNGKMKITLKEDAVTPIVLNVRTDFTVGKDGDARKLNASMHEMRIAERTFAEGAIFEILSQTSDFKDYDDTLLGFMEDQMRLYDVTSGVIGCVNDTINQTDIRTKMSDSLSQYILASFDKVLGSVNGALPTTKTHQERNEVDQYFFDRIRYSLCTEGSKFYLRKLIHDWDNPNLDRMALGTIDLSPATPTDGFSVDRFVLKDVMMNDLSNLDVKMDNIDFVLGEAGERDMATMKALLNVTVEGGLELSLNGEQIDGEFTAHLKESPFNLACNISGNKVEDLTVTVVTSEIEFVPGTLRIELRVEAELKNLIEGIINTPGVLSTIVDKINEKIADGKADLGDSATQKIREFLEQTKF
jgi:hypothetical protein